MDHVVIYIPTAEGHYVPMKLDTKQLNPECPVSVRNFADEVADEIAAKFSHFSRMGRTWIGASVSLPVLSSTRV